MSDWHYKVYLGKYLGHEMESIKKLEVGEIKKLQDGTVYLEFEVLPQEDAENLLKMEKVTVKTYV